MRLLLRGEEEEQQEEEEEKKSRRTPGWGGADGRDERDGDPVHPADRLQAAAAAAAATDRPLSTGGAKPG